MKAYQWLCETKKATLFSLTPAKALALSVADRLLIAIGSIDLQVFGYPVPFKGAVHTQCSFLARNTVPELGGNSVVSIFIRVLLPAPFGPVSPKSSPRLTENVT
jgi:hypothetical protein